MLKERIPEEIMSARRERGQKSRKQPKIRGRESFSEVESRGRHSVWAAGRGRGLL